MWPKLGRTAYFNIYHNESYKQEKKFAVSCTSISLCLIYYVDMTEYDYSLEAYERHLATQEKIARWVDQTLEQSPCDPFAPSVPSERSTTQITQTPLPAFHATPHGDISPTYYSNSRMHEHSQWHSPSQRSSTPSTPLIMPQARPLLGRSFTNPAPSAGQPLPYPPYPSPTAPPSRVPSPYSSRHSSRHQPPSPMPHRSSSQNSFRSVHSHSHSHSHANPVIQQQHVGNTYPYFAPSLPQPLILQPQHHVVVVRADRGFTVVPPPGHQVQVVVRFF